MNVSGLCLKLKKEKILRGLGIVNPNNKNKLGSNYHEHDTLILHMHVTRPSRTASKLKIVCEECSIKALNFSVMTT